VGDFQFSAYLKSPLINALHQDNRLELAEMVPALTNVVDEARRKIKERRPTLMSGIKIAQLLLPARRPSMPRLPAPFRNISMRVWRAQPMTRHEKLGSLYRIVGDQTAPVGA
jgi:hypothetical protein